MSKRARKREGVAEVLILILALFTAFLFQGAAPKQASAVYNSNDYCTNPALIGSGSVPPMVMLTVEKDQKLWKKAYSDYSDLDGDGLPDITFKPSIDYYGYFDPYKCYTYDSTNTTYKPVRSTSTKICGGGARNDAALGEWSGNFLNWATMTRLDVMRKTLYGGYRFSEGNTSGAILERAFLPQDSHSFNKVFNDCQYDVNYNVTGSGMLHDYTAFDASAGSDAYNPKNCWDPDNTLNMCSATIGSLTAPPWVRIARGGIPNPDGYYNSPGFYGFPRWATSERWQCAYQGEANKPAAPSNVIRSTFNSTLHDTASGGDWGPYGTTNASDISYSTSDYVGSSGASVVLSTPNANDDARLEETVTTVAGHYYQLEYYYKNGTAAHAGYAEARDDTGSTPWIFGGHDYSDFYWDNAAWTFHQHRFKAISNSTRIYLAVHNVTSTTNITGMFDEVTMRDMGTLDTSGPYGTSSPEVINWPNPASYAYSPPSPYVPQGNKIGDYTVHIAACQPGNGSDGKPLLGTERCRLYPKGDYKPSGLLESYGEDGTMHFGLITGSYKLNKSGGILRSKITDMYSSGDINQSYGTFTGTNTGLITTLGNKGGGNGKRSGIDIIGYNYSDATDPGTYNNTFSCKWGRSDFNDGQCVTWGNPLGEMEYEAMRYFMGIYPNTTDYYTSSNPDLGLPLPQESWNKNVDPFQQKYSQPCEQAFNLILSEPYPSYDSDQVPGGYSGFGNIAGDTPDFLNKGGASGFANIIGGNEGMYNGGTFFVGESGSSNDRQCTAKTITNLAQVRGQCPNDSGTEGSFYLPAVAYYANTNDLRTGSVGISNQDGSQNMVTYSVALSSGLPQISLLTNSVTIVPSCFDSTLHSGPGRPCTIVDFHINSYKTCDPAHGLTWNGTAPNPYNYAKWGNYPYMGVACKAGDVEGDIHIYWEDSQQGGDYDQDADGILHFYADAAAKTVWTYVDVEGNSTPYNLDTGFIITGTTADGQYITNTYVNDGSGPPQKCDVTTSPTGTGCSWQNTFTQGTGGAQTLHDPMWYAAKYGGFVDLNGNGVPDEGEWDTRVKGTPDTYFLVQNPNQLESSLVAAFNSILNRASSGTAASVLASGEGSGANLLQAIYFPRRRFASTEISWSGVLQNLWYYVDPYFNTSTIREDTDQNMKLNLTKDYIITMFFNSDSNKTYALRGIDSLGVGNIDSYAPTVEFTNIKSLWEAGKLLWMRNLDTEPRTIWTYDVTNGTGSLANPSGLIAFDNSTASKNLLSPFINAPSFINGTYDTTGDIIDWTRGYLISTDYQSPGTLDWRTRTADIDLNSNGNTNDDVQVMLFNSPDGGTQLTTTVNEVNEWKLGDIISSTPKIQSRFKMHNYDSLYGDKTYGQFVQDSCIINSAASICPVACTGGCPIYGPDDQRRYLNRGTVFTGANDGMLHAFKLGKLMLAGVDYTASDPHEVAELTVPASEIVAGDLVASKYPGKELWAYIPLNSLPYLRLMAEPTYCHNTNVDLAPYVFDASIIGNTPDSARNNMSWRTILIGGFRLGGACRDNGGTCGTGGCVKAPLTATVDGVSGTSVGYSSYFALDVTDPYNPTLMWEFKDPALGFSSSGPAIVRIASSPTGSPDSTNGNWFVVIGSGPTGPIDTTNHQFMGQSDQHMQLFVLDLKTGALLRTIDTNIANAFASSMVNVTIDLNVNYSDDVLYVGYTKAVTSGGATTWTDGGVGRLITNEDYHPANWIWSTVIDGTGPVTVAPAKLLDTRNNRMWLYFGTGRFFFKNTATADDLTSPRKLYGISDPCLVNFASLTVSGIWNSVCTTDTGGQRATAPATGSLTNMTDTNSQATLNTNGWYINLMANSTGAERDITDPLATTAGFVYFTTYIPQTSMCKLDGTTYLWAVKYDTGGLPAGIAGTAIIQVSTGAIQQMDLSKTFVDKGASNSYGRRSGAMVGAPPNAQGLSILGSPPPVKRIIHQIER